MIDVFLQTNTRIADVRAVLAGFDCQRVLVRNDGPTEVWKRTTAGWEQESPGMTLFEDLTPEYIDLVAYNFKRPGSCSELVGDGMVLVLSDDEAAEWLATAAPHRYVIEDAIGCTVNVVGKDFVCAAPTFAISEFKRITDVETALGRKILAWIGQVQAAGADQVGMSISKKKDESGFKDELDVPWGKWLSELQEILGHAVASFNGWGECYGAGLSPAEAVACRDHGTGREAVIEYCSTSDVKFDLNFG